MALAVAHVSTVHISYSTLSEEDIKTKYYFFMPVIEKLIQKKVEVGEFISKWYKVGPEQPTSIPEKPALKPTEPKPVKPESIKVKVSKPKPDAKAPTDCDNDIRCNCCVCVERGG